MAQPYVYTYIWVQCWWVVVGNIYMDPAGMSQNKGLAKNPKWLCRKSWGALVTESVANLQSLGNYKLHVQCDTLQGTRSHIPPKVQKIIDSKVSADRGYVRSQEGRWIEWRCEYLYMGVSKNRGTPKSSILIGISIINHPVWGYHYFWKHPYILSESIDLVWRGPERGDTVTPLGRMRSRPSQEIPWNPGSIDEVEKCLLLWLGSWVRRRCSTGT